MLRADLERYYYDALLVDQQMLAPDAFGALAAFSTTLNGNGMDLSTDADTAEQTMARYRHMTGFANEEYDKLIEAAYNERDLEKRAAILHEAEELLLENMPIIPLTFGQNHYVFSNKIRNVDMDYYGYAYFTKTRLKNYQDYLPEAEENEGE
jgi:ABC-type transport system substrate-binding protein